MGLIGIHGSKKQGEVTERKEAEGEGKRVRQMRARNRTDLA